MHARAYIRTYVFYVKSRAYVPMHDNYLKLVQSNTTEQETDNSMNNLDQMIRSMSLGTSKLLKPRAMDRSIRSDITKQSAIVYRPIGPGLLLAQVLRP